MAKVVVLLVVFAALTMVEMGNGYCFLADTALHSRDQGHRAPTPACCDSISKISQVCLCQAVSGPETPKAGLSVGKALVLPLECGINVPSGTTCAGCPVPKLRHWGFGRDLVRGFFPILNPKRGLMIARKNFWLFLVLLLCGLLFLLLVRCAGLDSYAHKAHLTGDKKNYYKKAIRTGWKDALAWRNKHLWGVNHCSTSYILYSFFALYLEEFGLATLLLAPETVRKTRKRKYGEKNFKWSLLPGGSLVALLLRGVKRYHHLFVAVPVTLQRCKWRE
ncbi:hypothetical protein SELMODRAFT_412449 [Selaginella moellendorffii]|uniref:Bifunctional inhibitor/plant lipid transfer protein/seed storage helical domain-containing protein n=1 Tax=Selaginella moellendorffii TaxID=88036 RepID=D8RLI7_SELML|nr:hypothetical protein SELMODRAFT_412449 [Selaginella moellendorffii]